MAVSQVSPGNFFIPELGKTIKITDVRQDAFFDTEEQVSGAITSGSKLDIFKDLSNKNKHHTNLTNERRIPGRNKFNLLRVGVHVRQAWGNTIPSGSDTLKVYEAGALSFSINTRLVTEGPLLRYQSGYGVTGATTATDTSILTLGTPSQVAAPKFIAAHPVDDTDDLACDIRFDHNTWMTTTTMPTLAAASLISVFLDGIVEKPITT